VLRFALTDRIHLRLPQPGDAEELWALTVANQEHLAPWMPWANGELRIDQTADWIRASERQVAEDNGFQCLVVEDGRLSGAVGFHRVDWVNGLTSVGYWLAARAQGRGTMTAAVGVLIAHAFDGWGLHRVTIEAAPGNVRSRAIPERLGFTEEGVLREAKLVRGRYEDAALYAMLASDWPPSPAREAIGSE
jgi:ribosomal-protein-serine acetyltransferase